MKELIILAIDQAFVDVENALPHSKVIFFQESVFGETPKDIVKYMIENNIPEEATLVGDENGDVLLRWEKTVPTTETDKAEFKKQRFNAIIFRYVYKHLTENGFKRVGFNSALLKQFSDTTVHNMVVNGEFDRLVEYYSLHFKKVE